MAIAALLRVPLIVAVHPVKKPFVYKGVDNLNTGGHELLRLYMAPDFDLGEGGWLFFSGPGEGHP